MKLVSVIIPAYNLEKYIISTLDSIVNQVYENIEIIVIDDGSNDNTYKAASEFLAEIKFEKYKVKSIKNSGVSAARNKGFEIATGDYIIFLDGDDKLKEDIICKFVEKLERENSDICFCGYIEYKEVDGSISCNYLDDKIYLNKTISGTEALIKKLSKEIWICTGNAIYKRELLEKNQIKYTEGIAYGEDIEFINKSLLCSRFVSCVPEEGFICLMRQSSALRKKFSSKFLDALMANRNFHDFVNNGREIDLEKRNYILKLIDYDYNNTIISIIDKIFLDSTFVQAVKTYKKIQLKFLNTDMSFIYCKVGKKWIVKYKLFKYSPTVGFFIMKLSNFIRL